MRTIFVLFLASRICFGANRTLRYEPDKVSLEGTLELQTFPGRPNYESIQNGDEAETQWYLRLNEPIEVEPNPKNQAESSELEKNVKIVQVVIDDKDWSKRGEGKRIRASGSLFHRWSGHHHARVLLNIDTMSVLSSKVSRHTK